MLCLRCSGAVIEDLLQAATFRLFVGHAVHDAIQAGIRQERVINSFLHVRITDAWEGFLESFLTVLIRIGMGDLRSAVSAGSETRAEQLVGDPRRAIGRRPAPSNWSETRAERSAGDARRTVG